MRERSSNVPGDTRVLKRRETIVSVETSRILVSVGVHVQVCDSRGLWLSLKVKRGASGKKGHKEVEGGR